MLNNIEKVNHIQIQGGEPLLYDKLGEIISFCGQNKKIEEISMTTNGIISPSEDILDSCYRNSVSVDISNYNSFKNVTMLNYELYKSHGINCQYYDFSEGDGSWNDMGGVQYISSKETEEDLEKKFHGCKFSGCLTLENGELAHCSRASHAYIIQCILRKETDYIKILNEEDFKVKLRKYIYDSHYMEACKYCRGSGTDKRVIAGEQIS